MRSAVLWTCALAAALAGLASSSAFARWERVRETPSNSAPYFVCPSRPHAARCQLIDDPTLGSHIAGPLPAGTITKGPEQEVSPATSGSGIEGGYAPSDLQSAYRLPSSASGTGQTVAIVDAFNDPNAEADLKVYRTQYGLGECTMKNGCFRKVNQRGESTMPAPNKTWAREISLDLDMVSAICPNCHLLLVEADNESGASLATAENEAAASGATEINDSYEEEENSEHASAYDHPGISITAAAGDHSYGVVFPAAGAHVIAVGGTSLVPAAGRRGWEETVWHTEGSAPLSGTGSGCSIEPKPAWQIDVGCTHRTDNDIAAVADPNTPVSAYDSFETAHAWQLLGGTSVSAPIIAAAMALATPYTRSFDGARALYLEIVNGGTLNDVVSGANAKCGNYLCEAGRGYDGPSGLGTLDGAPEVPPPMPVTAGSSSVSQRQATLVGSVNPHGVALSSCVFQYGPTTAYGSLAPCASLPAGGTSAAGVSALAAGLSPATLYHFRLEVSYAGGTSEGMDLTFTTTGLAPGIAPGQPTNIRPSSVTLNAQVDPNGASTGCWFEYGMTASYGSTASCQAAPGAGQSPVSVAATVSGLVANSVYHFRTVAANGSGTAYGPDQTVTLPPFAPSVVTRAPTAVAQTSAVLNATVDANGGALATCEFEFNSAETFVPCSVAPAALAGAADVSASVKGLASGSVYRYRVIAANAGGTTYGSLVQFASLPSQAQDAARYGARLATLSLIVGADGAARVRIRCPAAHHTRCRGRVTLRSEPAGKAGGKTLVLGSGAFVAGAGRVTTVRVQLAALARHTLAHTRLLHVRVTLRTVTRGGATSAWHGTATLSSGG